jgi:hypothetical protein
MSAIETYLATLTALHGATVPETANYAALQTLLNAAGESLRPKVQAILHPRNTGAGIPDLGLIDDNQPADQKPARGIIEAKPVSANLMTIAEGEQVARYVQHYGQALVTNYYQFVLVTRDARSGQPIIEERYDLAPDADSFWQAARQPRKLAEPHENALREYLLRVMRRNAPLTTPQDVAWILASYAREARARIEAGGHDLNSLNTIRQQLETALGVRFQDATAEEFFRSTLVQTLFYGLFSAWVLWHEKNPAGTGKFDLWRDTRRLNIPVISELFNQFSDGSTLPLSVEQILIWTTDALNRVDRTAFFAAFNKGAAVQYFYEPFLEAFDPDLRRQLGVWYTPPEVVEYMVARVDAALKTELGIADGLADPQVYVLDPCCGTGAYLVAVLRHIYTALERRDGAALAGQAVQAAMRERVFGFEILPAPFVVAHLQIGMLLNGFRAPLTGSQRAGVYLTNALTGWEAGDGPRTALMFPELEREREAAEAVKQGRPILVILGNPPYSGFAGVAVEEERALTDAYRTTVNPALPRPQGQGLNDLYIRFYRMAERRIVESTGRGVVSFISNYSWLDGLSHPGMRERYLEAFDQIYIDNLHGDRIISEYAPDGRTSETIFAMRGASTGIKVGTAIATLIRKPAPVGTPFMASGPGDEAPRATLYYRDWQQARADERRQALLNSLQDQAGAGYQIVQPIVEIGLPFKPRAVGAGYLDWPMLPELFPTSFPGVKTSRDDVLVDTDRERLEARMKHYFDPTISHEEMKQLEPGFMDDSARYDAKAIRDTLRKRGYLPGQIVRYCYRPFDVRWLYWEPETKLLDEKRPEYFPHAVKDNPYIFTTNRVRRGEMQPPVFTRALNDINTLDGSAAGFPLYLYGTPKDQLSFLEADAVPLGGRKPNLSERAIAYLQNLTPDAMNGVPTGAEAAAETLFYHTLAVLHAPRYRVENAGALQQDWPRVPLPTSREVLDASAALGRQVAALLDVETPVPGVTQGDPRPELRSVGVLTSREGTAPDFTINVGWGHFGSGSAVMPGRGRVAEAPPLQPSRLRETALERGLGGEFLDIYLNDTTWWAGVPVGVWDYTLGGYQVLKKWLSYRETDVLGRPLKPEEAREFMHIARRIAALLALNAALDANYAACR